MPVELLICTLGWRLQQLQQVFSSQKCVNRCHQHWLLLLGYLGVAEMLVKISSVVRCDSPICPPLTQGFHHVNLSTAWWRLAAPQIPHHAVPLLEDRAKASPVLQWICPCCSHRTVCQALGAGCSLGRMKRVSSGRAGKGHSDISITQQPVTVCTQGRF